MKEVFEVIEVLKALDYKPIHDDENKDIHFTSFGFDAFPERHKDFVRTLLGDKLSEFYYGSNTQHIYYR